MPHRQHHRLLATMGRETETVTGATEAGEAMAAPAAGMKRAWEATDGDEMSNNKPEHFQYLEAMLKANCAGSNASPGSSTPSTMASTSVAGSPASILQSPLAEPVFNNEIAQSKNMDVDLELDDELEILKKMGVSPFAATGSSEAAFDLGIIGDHDAPPTILGSPETAPSTSLSVAPAVPSSWTEELRKAEENLVEPAPPKVVEGIGTATDDDAKSRRWAKLADEGFDLRCGPGRQFARAPESKSDAYKSLMIAQKAEFRKQWAHNIYQSLRKAKVQSETSSKIDVSKGMYMPFACIVREEGNDDAGMTAAVHYVQACQVMAGVWKKWNLMTKRWEFLYMRQEVHEIFEQSWKVFEEHQNGGGHQETGPPAPGDGASAVTGSSEAAVPAVGKQKGQLSPCTTKTKGAVTGPTEAAAKKSKGSQPKPNTPDSKKTPFEVALQDALATRKMYMTVTSKVSLVTEQINTNQAWEWARGHYQAEIIKIGDPLKELASTGFARLFLMQELKDIKKAYCQNDLLTHTVQFCKDFDVVLAKSQKLLNKLTAMQSESMK